MENASCKKWNFQNQALSTNINSTLYKINRRKKILFILLSLLFLFGTINSLQRKDAAVKVLVLAYSRSGSSWLGELLSAGSNTSYVYEPFFKMSYSFYKDKSELRTLMFKDRIEGLMNCDQNTINLIPRPELNTNMKECLKSTTRVIKTIRAHGDDLKDWIFSSNIKVVHLVRDPRGMIQSMASRPDTWKVNKALYSSRCNEIKSDLDLLETLETGYIRVRYEDLATSPEREAERIFQHLGLKFSDQVKKFIYDHTNADKKKYKYYGTFRKSDFKADLWKASLKLDEIRDIESRCENVLGRLNYPIFEAQERENYLNDNKGILEEIAKENKGHSKVT